MIGNLCLVCHDSCDETDTSNHKIDDIHNKEYSKFKLNLERILKRRIIEEKFQEKQICAVCFQLVKEYESLEEKLIEISDNLTEKFQVIHPSKRGRRKKDEIIEKVEKVEIKTENVEIEKKEIIRKSGRKRKIKEIEIYVDPEKEFFDNCETRKHVKVKEQAQILSSMATKCPHCDFAADSDIQVSTSLTLCISCLIVIFT